MSAADDIQTETEIKLDLGSFTNYLKLLGFLGQIDSEIVQQNCFFDTAQRHLARAGWALRVRHEPARGLITVKGTTEQHSVVAVRQEIEAVIDSATALAIIEQRQDLLSLAVGPISFVRSTIGDERLEPLVRFENSRRQKQHLLADRPYLIEIDKTEYADGTCDYELELEIRDAAEIPTVDNCLRRLFQSLGMPYTIQYQSKFHRALIKAGLA